MSEIITRLLVLHSAGFKYLKHFYHGLAGPRLRPCLPAMPCYQQFVTVQKWALVPLIFFRLSRLGNKTAIYYIDRTALPICDNHRLHRHQTCAGWAQRGKTSMGWFFSFKLQLVFNHRNQSVACKLSCGQGHDTKPVAQLTSNLRGKLLADKGYISYKLAQELLRHGLTLFTRMRQRMRAWPLALSAQLLLNARNMAETIIGSIKEFAALNLPQHRWPLNAFLHLVAAITAYQINPIKPQLKLHLTYPLAIPA